MMAVENTVSSSLVKIPFGLNSVRFLTSSIGIHSLLLLKVMSGYIAEYKNTQGRRSRELLLLVLSSQLSLD